MGVKLPACMPMEGPDWKCWPIGKWVECMSIAAIVLSIVCCGSFTWLVHDRGYGGYGGGLTLIVGICALVNKCAGIHNACFYKVLWIIELICACINTLGMLLTLIFTFVVIADCNRDDGYYGYYERHWCTYAYIACVLWFLFAIPYVIFQFIYAYILFRAEKCQQGRDGQEFP